MLLFERLLTCETIIKTDGKLYVVKGITLNKLVCSRVTCFEFTERPVHCISAFHPVNSVCSSHTR